MTKKTVNDITRRIQNLNNFFKLYYSYEEDNEFKVWLEYHDQDGQVNKFYDNLHELMDPKCSAALTELFKEKPEKMQKILMTNKNLLKFFSDYLFVLELFDQEWDKYINQDGQYIHITLTPDNDVNDSINNNSDKVVRFDPHANKGNDNKKDN